VAANKLARTALFIIDRNSDPSAPPRYRNKPRVQPAVPFAASKLTKSRYVGHERTCDARAMFALPLKADIRRDDWNVRFALSQ
jgi:hypothetical protein